jgi:hypothetical protein
MHHIANLSLMVCDQFLFFYTPLVVPLLTKMKELLHFHFHP